LPEELHVHPGVIVESFKMGEGHQTAEVFVPFLVHGQKNQVVGVRAPVLRHGAVLAVAGGDIHFTTQDGFDTLVRALGEKLHGAENVPVVRDGHRFHVESAGFVQQLTDPDRTVQEAVFCVNMKVNEGGWTSQRNLISFYGLQGTGADPMRLGENFSLVSAHTMQGQSDKEAKAQSGKTLRSVPLCLCAFGPQAEASADSF